MKKKLRSLFILNTKMVRFGISTGLMLLMFLSSVNAQNYIINRGDINGGAGNYTGSTKLCVVDKNEYYQPYRVTAASLNKIAVHQYKNGVISDWGTNTSFPTAASGAFDIARDSVNQIIYLSFVTEDFAKIYTYKRAVTDNDWVLVNSIDKPSATNLGYNLNLAFNKNSGTLFMSFVEATATNKVYLYELNAGTWTNRTGSNSMSTYNSGFSMSVYGNKVILSTTPLVSSYYTLRVHSWNVNTNTFTNFPSWNNGLTYQRIFSSSTAYKSGTDEYVMAVASSDNAGIFYPKVLKSVGGAAWVDMSNGLPAEAITNSSVVSSIVYNNLNDKFSLFYAASSSSTVKGYYWDGTTWINMSVPYMSASNTAAFTNYKDVYFVAWNASTPVGIYSTNETPARNTMNISATPTTTSSTFTFPNRGVGNKVAVFIKSGAYVAPVTADATTYTANTAFGSGTQLGTSGWYCVYNGVGQAVSVTGLTAGSTYQVQALEYNGAVATEKYIGNGAVTGNPIAFTTVLGTAITTTTTTEAISVFPNPATESLYIKGINAKTTVCIYDALGVLVQKTINNGIDKINVSNLNSGVYFIKLSGIETNGSIRFVKK